MYELTSVQLVVVSILPVLFAITVHEVAHGWVALRFGDPTAKMLGRLTLNPLKHIDPIGTVVLPILLILTLGFAIGYAKPVPITAANLRNPKRDMIWVALAGPGANLLMAVGWVVIGSISLKIANASMEWINFVLYSCAIGGFVNVALMVLNLLPIPPLDGGRVVSGLLPGRWDWYFSKLEPYGLLIVLALIATGVWRYAFLPLIDTIYTNLAFFIGFTY